MSWRLSNPVHMELQENAKLPTFTWPVDRTGSAYQRRAIPGQYPTTTSGEEQRHESGMSPSRHEAARRSDINDDNHHNPQVPTKSLAEKFLQTSQRSTLNATYAQAGALHQHHLTTAVGAH